ncbi:MAG TPA: NlpC/P60 family protein [Acidimicrobiales bacterium]|nr:NlpC/P60 family protein [Acidimicrobiales bacterium]
MPRGPAGAATEASLRSQAASLTARLGQLAQQEARVDEQYNQARLALAAAQTHQQQAQAAAARAAAQVTARRRVLTSAAVDAYMRGGSGAGAGGVTLLMQSNQTTYGIQQSYLQSVADTQQSAIDGLRQAQAQLAAQQSRLARATRSARSDVATAAGLRSQLGSTASSEVSALSQVRGQLAQMVAADQAAAQAAQAAAARARLQALSHTTASAGRPVSRDNPLPALGGGSRGGGSAVGPIGPAPSQGGAAGVALEWAQRELGKPYVYGGAGPDSFDCSGLIMYIFGQAGVSLPHSAAGQWDDTTRISYAQARPGDLVFFYQPVDHVGIYVGNGEMIDAPHTGADVEYDPIWWNVLDGFGRVG